MGKIKIPTKKAVLSNKDQTLPEIPETKTMGATASTAMLTPFVDRLAVVVTPPTAELGKLIHDSFFLHANEPSLFSGASYLKGYTISRRIVLGDGFPSKANPHLAVDHAKGQISRLRLEFSPANLGTTGIHQLASATSVFLPDGWDFVLEYGMVRKLEVTVDIPQVPTASLHILPTQVTSAQTWSSAGQLQTVVLGKSKAQGQTRIYDRGVKRKAKGQFEPEYEGTRVERVLTLGRPVPDLIKLKNPFSHLKFAIAPPPPPSEQKQYIWTMFMDSVAARTLPVALKLLPVERRTTYRKWLTQNAVAWWDPDAIWEHWPDYLISSGLLKKPAKSFPPKG